MGTMLFISGAQCQGKREWAQSGTQEVLTNSQELHYCAGVEH